MQQWLHTIPRGAEGGGGGFPVGWQDHRHGVRGVLKLPQAIKSRSTFPHDGGLFLRAYASKGTRRFDTSSL